MTQRRNSRRSGAVAPLVAMLLVVANNPPSTGFFKNQAGYIEVNTTFYQGRYFSWVLGLWPINATLTNTMPVTARAVAERTWVPFHAGVLLLNYTGSDLQDTGNG